MGRPKEQRDIKIPGGASQGSKNINTNMLRASWGRSQWETQKKDFKKREKKEHRKIQWNSQPICNLNREKSEKRNNSKNCQNIA